MHVLCFDETLEFSVQSALYFESLAAVPHNISTDLMRKSCTNKVGMWVLEEISGKYVYSLMHNCVLDELTDSGFERSVRYMINRVEEFDAAIHYLSGQSSSSFASEFGREFARSAGARLGAVAVGALFSFLSS